MDGNTRVPRGNTCTGKTCKLHTESSAHHWATVQPKLIVPKLTELTADLTFSFSWRDFTALSSPNIQEFERNLFEISVNLFRKNDFHKVAVLTIQPITEWREVTTTYTQELYLKIIWGYFIRLSISILHYLILLLPSISEGILCFLDHCFYLTAGVIWQNKILQTKHGIGF